MIVAGIDEAGYGPLLGPLVVGCCAFEVADENPSPLDAAELPCLWKRLGNVVSRTRSKTGRKLHVNDSKQVYSPGIGLKELEKSVLAMAAAWRQWPDGMHALLAQVATGLPDELQSYPWYQPPPHEPWPLSQDGMPVRLFGNALRQEMRHTNCQLVHLSARVLLERQFNRQCDATRNKSSVLFSAAAVHLDHLLRHFGQKRLVIFCDRQGGREHYGPLLRMMFEDWSLEIVSEGDGHSEYQLSTGPHTVRIIFTEKAEAQCLPVAMASMLCKYLRESLMHRFNAYWKSMLPQLEPTAGYHGDGTRFLKEIDSKRRELGIADADLIRSR